MSFKRPIDLVIFDLDGVLVNTRKIHFEAWRITLNSYLNEMKLPLFTEEEYREVVDGKPRYEGVKSFFKGRNIILTEPVIKTICDSKNNKFREILSDHHAEIFPETIYAIKRLEAYGIQMAVVSSSENCNLILEILDLKKYFNVIIDAEQGKLAGLLGKPEPDYFLEASKRAGIEPQKCAIVEDAISGIQAGKSGGFKRVYGIQRSGQTSGQDLYAAGADYVISSLMEIGGVPNALIFWDKIVSRISDSEIALFLDFDGTLSEISPTPDKAVLSEVSRRILDECSKSMKVAIISGRDRLNVKKLVGLDHIFYAGCHGFDISGPGCFHYTVDSVKNSLKSLEQISLILESSLSEYPGILFEKKTFGTAVHYRQTPAHLHESIKEKINKCTSNFHDLKIKDGKKVLELIPNIEWDKSHAIDKLSEVLNLNEAKTIKIFIGDDKTDEEAFVNLDNNCIRIRVDETGRYFTNADFSLHNPFEVESFLTKLMQTHAGKLKKWRRGA